MANSIQAEHASRAKFNLELALLMISVDRGDEARRALTIVFESLDAIIGPKSEKGKTQ